MVLNLCGPVCYGLTELKRPVNHNNIALSLNFLFVYFRYIFIAAAIHWLCKFRRSDVFYTPLPLYHTAGGCMTIGQMLIYGSTVVIRKKFSASGYFADCRKYNCTVSKFIGCNEELFVTFDPLLFYF